MFLKSKLAPFFLCLCFSFIISFLPNTAYAQGTSNKGTDFWVAYAGHIDGTDSRLTLFITSEFNATVTINAGGTVLQQVNIAANQAQAVVINPTVYTNVYVGSSEVVETNKGIHVTSDKAIIVYSHISHTARSAATLIFPTKVLGNDYYTINYTQLSGTNRYSEFTIVGVEDGTDIEIIPSQKSITNAHLANIPFTKTLNKGDVYQYQSTTDLSGSRIHTLNGCKPIAVFSGSTFTAYCESTNTANAGTGDNLYQQLLPISAWGKNFVSAPFYNTLHGSTDIYRIIVATDNTTITVNGSTTSANGTAMSNPYAKGSVLTFNSKLANGIVISADKPISVAQFQTTQACNPNNQVQGTLPYPGDPEMTILNPIEQTLKDVTVYSAVSTAQAVTNITKHFINVIIKTADAPSLKIDGSAFPASQFTAINSEYSYLVHDVTQSSTNNPTHRITADGGFVAIAYGYGNPESYGYLAGSDLKNLNQYIEAVNNTTNQLVTDGCVGQPYKFILRLPYITNSLIWDFGNGNVYTNPLPAYTTETSNNTTIYKYEYAGNGGVIFNTPGSYKLKVHATNPAPAGCDADEEIDFDFDIYNPPTTQFSSLAEVCINTGLAFTDQSNGQGKNIVSWLWDFGDNTTSSAQNPVHIYTAAGTFTVTLITTGETGCTSATFSKTIKANELPAAKFSYPTITCETKDIIFTDESVSTDGIIISRVWDFGDSTSSSAQNPVHNFTKAGTYKVTLKVLTDKGCESILFSADVIVHPMPKIDFEMPDFCLSDATASFINKTTIADGSQLTYLWDFGDKNANTARPNTSSLANPSHVYTETGYYTITLTVTSANSCGYTITKTFTVNGSTPKADFKVQNSGSLCSNQPVLFQDNSSVDFGEITKIEWYYDFGNPAVVKETDDNPALRNGSPRIYSHTYPTFTTPISKTIMVRMVTYSGVNCVDDEIKTIVLHAVPDADFEIPPACLTDGLANFNDISTIADAPASFTYLWDFGDPNANAQRPNTSTVKAPVHAYTTAGNYQVSLTVTAANGCSVTRIKSITVSGSIPKPDFNILNSNSLCSDQPVLFEDKATLAFGEITRIEWYFDNTTNPTIPELIDNSPNLRTASSKQYSFSYQTFHSPMTKSINVRMKAFSGAICVDEIIKPLILKAVPELVFDTITSICEEKPPVQLTEAKEIHNFPGSGVYSGKGVSPSGIFDPKSAGPGTHIITYTFSGTNGCIESKSQTVNVFPTPVADAGVDIIILQGGQIKINATASGSNLKYQWTPAKGLDHDDILNPVASPDDDITYVLTVTSDQGCSFTDAVFVKVLKSPEVPNTFTPNGDGINDVWNIKYLESYPGATIEIYNRYGSKIYSSSGSQAWDGKMQGENLPAGTYYYIINPKNGRKIISGSITIVR